MLALAILGGGYIAAVLLMLPFVRPARTRRYPVRPYRDMPTQRQSQSKADRYTLAA